MQKTIFNPIFYSALGLNSFNQGLLTSCETTVDTQENDKKDDPPQNPAQAFEMAVVRNKNGVKLIPLLVTRSMVPLTGNTPQDSPEKPKIESPCLQKL